MQAAFYHRKAACILSCRAIHYPFPPHCPKQPAHHEYCPPSPLPHAAAPPAPDGATRAAAPFLCALRCQIRCGRHCLFARAAECVRAAAAHRRSLGRLQHDRSHACLDAGGFGATEAPILPPDERRLPAAANARNHRTANGGGRCRLPVSDLRKRAAPALPRPLFPAARRHIVAAQPDGQMPDQSRPMRRPLAAEPPNRMGRQPMVFRRPRRLATAARCRRRHAAIFPAQTLPGRTFLPIHRPTARRATSPAQ